MFLFGGALWAGGARTGFGALVCPAASCPERKDTGTLLRTATGPGDPLRCALCRIGDGVDETARGLSDPPGQGGNPWFCRMLMRVSVWSDGMDKSVFVPVDSLCAWEG